MPGSFPAGLEFSNGTDIGTSLSTSAGTGVTPSATANTKGSYVQLVASTGADASWVDVAINNGAGGAGGYGVDIAIGASGSEQIIVNNLVVTSLHSLVIPYHYFFPISIPAGTAISARSQSGTASDAAVTVGLTLFDGAMTMIEGCAGVDGVGFLTATSQGTIIDAGAVAGTKGSYTQLTGSSSRDYIGFVLGFDNQNNTNSGLSTNLQIFDIAVGGAGSEKIIVSNYGNRRVNSGSTNAVACSPPMFIPIPSGTAISARSASEVSTTPSRTMGVTLYGIYQ